MPDPDPTPDPTPDPDPTPEPPLGDAGKRALDAERTARREAETAAKQLVAERDRLTAELEEVRAGQLSDQDKALEAARKEAREAATAETDEKYRKRLDAADVKATATKFADPADAILYLDVDSLPRDADGTLEPKALADALGKVLEDKPHLAAKPNPGSADGGPRGGDGPAQLTRDDLKTMTPEAIVEAKAAGQLASLLGHT